MNIWQNNSLFVISLVLFVGSGRTAH